MNDKVVKLWSNILAALPDSRLFLKSKQLQDASMRQQTIARFAAHGITADRLILEGTCSRADYFKSYHRIDIALDPFPYPGGTTSVESLWMGVPMLTLTGSSFLSRQGAGIMVNAGLSNWVASDDDEYLAYAIKYSRDLQVLNLLRLNLRRQTLASSIMDGKSFALQFSTALHGMWLDNYQK